MPILVYLIAAIGLFGMGFMTGNKWEKGVEAQKEIQIVEKQVEVVKKVYAGDAQISGAYEKGRAEMLGRMTDQRKAFNDTLEALKGATCSISVDALGVLNSARTGEPPVPSKPPEPVPAPPADTRRQDIHTSSANL